MLFRSHWNTEAVDVFGEDGGHMEGVKIRNRETNEESDLYVKGLFYAIGHTPNTSLFQGQIELDEVGYVVTQPGSVETNVEGVYAAGDVQDHEFRQAVTAAGTGCQAAMLAERWLSLNGLIQEFHQDLEAQESYQMEEEESNADTPETFDVNETRHVGGYALRRLFHESDRLIMVKYVSPNCGPCHTLKPILDKVVDEFEDKIHFVEVDIEAEPELAETAMVTGTPTVQFFRDQDIVDQMRGVKQKSEFRNKIESCLPAGVSAGS